MVCPCLHFSQSNVAPISGCGYILWAYNNFLTNTYWTKNEDNSGPQANWTLAQSFSNWPITATGNPLATPLDLSGTGLVVKKTNTGATKIAGSFPFPNPFGGVSPLTLQVPLTAAYGVTVVEFKPTGLLPWTVLRVGQLDQFGLDKPSLDIVWDNVTNDVTVTAYEFDGVTVAMQITQPGNPAGEITQVAVGSYEVEAPPSSPIFLDVSVNGAATSSESTAFIEEPNFVSSGLWKNVQAPSTPANIGTLQMLALLVPFTGPTPPQTRLPTAKLSMLSPVGTIPPRFIPIPCNGAQLAAGRARMLAAKRAAAIARS